MKYIKQLDSLRAFAVILVLISHWLPHNNIVNTIPNGFIGVTIFFVLSGFLITKILFENRIDAELDQLTKSKVLWQFYVRRALRIFPIYYLSIFILLIFSKSLSIDYNSVFPYLATYTTNFYILRIQYWPEYISHLWSLAVEEQFYLIWPWLILFINKKYYLYLITIFILIGVVGQTLTGAVKMNLVLTSNCFDAFGLGALISWQMTFRPTRMKKFYVWASIMAAISFILFIVGLRNNQWPYIPISTIISLISVWLIAYLIINQHSDRFAIRYLFNNKLLIWLGKISYGIYLYHNIIPKTLNELLIDKYLNPLLPDFIIKRYWGVVFVAENTILVILISWLSYMLIEKRFLALKKRFSFANKNELSNANVQQYTEAVR
jgi:peptidoglycan/LPS O-acetylase OafA/YrhL